MEEIKPIIRVDVGESEQTVKGLKKEISELKDRILNLKKGSDDYNDAVEQLQADQRKLNEVMALTKKEAVAVEGSYDALTHQMSLLKKEWRATADEAKRADLGKQIDEINQQLKDMDASVGNFQRNVGNYVSHWEGMPEVTKDFGAAMREMNETIEPTKQKFEAVGKISSGLASGFAVVQGAMALLGVESENLEKTFIKLQAAMALMQGVKGIGDLVEGLGKAKVAFSGLSKVIGGGAVGVIGAFVALAAAAIAVAGNLDKLKQKFTKLSEADKAAIAASKLNTELTKLSSQTASEKITRVKQLADAYNDLGDDLNAKKKFVEEYADELDDMGIKMTDVNDAENIFKNETENYINALMARAKANAIAKKAEQDYAKFLEERAVLEEELAQAKADRNRGTPKKTFWQNLGEAIIMGSNSEPGAPIETNTNLVNDWTKDIANENVANAEKNLNEATAKADAALKGAFEEAKALNEQADKYLKGGKKSGSSGGGKSGGKKPKTLDEMLKEIEDKLYQDAVNMEIEDIPIEIETDIKLKDEKLGFYKDFADSRIAFLERVAQREIDLNSASTLSDEEKAQKELEIRQKLEEDKLRILQEYKAKADSTSDWQSQLDLQQDIADQEVAITVAKNEAIIQSEERRKEKQTKIINNISAALSAAGSITQGILEITQAAAEKDGEISEQEAKRIKGMQYATATINMLAGITAALSGCFTTKTGPWDIVLAGVQAASIAAAGTANLIKIKNTDITGSVSSGAQAAVTPNSNVYGTDIPFSYTRQITGASEVDALNQDTRVYILESDIQESNKKVQVRESESSF